MPGDLEITVTIDTTERLRAFTSRGGQDFFDDLFKYFDRLSQVVAGRVVKESLSGPPGPRTLARRTGSLARSVFGRAEIIDGHPGMRIGVLRGPAERYAAIHERGGIVKPKNAKALAIPLSPVKTPAGVPRYESPRDYPGELQFLPSRRGRRIGFLFDPNESGGPGGSFLLSSLKWVLVTEVKIPARRWLSGPVYDGVPQVVRDINRWVGAYGR